MEETIGIDEYVIKKLEFWFNGLQISPYKTSKFIIFAGFFLLLYRYRVSLTDFNFLSILNILFIFQILTICYDESDTAMYRNDGGWDNIYRIDNKSLRVFSFLTAIYCLLFGLFIHSRFFISTFFELGIFIMHQYSVAMEFNKHVPRPKVEELNKRKKTRSF